MDPERVTYFGETDSRGKRIKFGIKAKDRTKHIYVIGKTGMGKSTLLDNMAIQDLQNGEGMAFIDPHGKSAEGLLNYIPADRINDVVYFAPFDIEHPISFNVLEDIGYDKRHLVVSGLISTFKKIWVDAWSARMEYMLTNALLALIETPGSTLLGVNRLLSDKEYRKRIVDNVKDPAVKSYWNDEFAKYTERQAAEAVPAIQNKVGQFTANPLIRNILGQSKSSFDIRKIMDEGKIMIINLSKGRVGEVNANLIGSMLITKIYLAAMSRADLQEKDLAKLPNFYLYVDEFQSFANESFADILSEARKYKLNLTIAHQYVEQMSEEVRAAVFGNVGTMITFRVGAYDAEVLEKEFAPQFTAEDLVNLGMYQMYLKLMINGVGSVPFSASSLPPYPEPVISYKSEIILSSRKNFAQDRKSVEESIIKWHEEGRIIKTSAPIVKSSTARPYTPDLVPPKKFTVESPKAPERAVFSVKKPEVKEYVKPIAKPKEDKTEPKKYEKSYPPIETEIDGDFLPLKELAKKIIIEPQKEEKTEAPKVAEKSFDIKPKTENMPHVKTMSEANLSDLRSALAAVMKKTSPTPELKKEEKKVETKAEPKKEEPKETPKPKQEKKAEEPKHSTKEIPEEDLKNILGI